MQVIYTKSAQKDLRKMPANARKSLMEKLQNYADNGQGDVKKLKGRSEYRLRHGQYRAIFTQQDDVIVITIAHRKEVYR